MGFELLRLERRDRVLVVRIDDPPFNFLKEALWEELDALTRQVKGDRSIGAVVIASAAEGTWVTHAYMPDLTSNAEVIGRPLSPHLAHGALKAAWLLNGVPSVREALRRTPLHGVLLLRLAGDLIRRMNRMNQVFIAAINGNAFGGGLELALGCDVRIAGDGDYKVGFIESHLGLMVGTGAAQRLAQSIGTAKTLELLIDGMAMSPTEAHERGLVHRLVPAGDLETEALAVAERLARRQPETTGALKRSLYNGTRLGRAVTIDQAHYASVAAAKGTLAAGHAYIRELDSLPQDKPLPTEILGRWYRGEAVDLVEGRELPSSGR